MELCSLPHLDVVFTEINHKALSTAPDPQLVSSKASHYRFILALECPNFFIEAQVLEVQVFIL